MKEIKFQKIVRALDVREYALEMETEIQVWVNPPRGKLVVYEGLAQAVRECNKELAEVRLAMAVREFRATEDLTPGPFPKREGVEEGSHAERGNQEGQGNQEKLQGLAGRLDELGRAQMEWVAELWSQGPEESRWTVDEVQSLVERALDTDPGLWSWLVRKTLGMIAEHRNGQKKA